MRLRVTYRHRKRLWGCGLCWIICRGTDLSEVNWRAGTGGHSGKGAGSMKAKELVRRKTAEIMAKRYQKPKGKGFYSGMERCDLAAWGEWTARGIKIVQTEGRNG